MDRLRMQKHVETMYNVFLGEKVVAHEHMSIWKYSIAI